MKRTLAILIFILGLVSACFAETGFVSSIDHEINQNNDGGYTITFSGSKRCLMPITPEGFFPKTDIHYQIKLRGKGKEWAYRNQPGFYYKFPEDIESTSDAWDLEYAWVDNKRERIYLNFYWVDAPNSLQPSEVNGVYKIEQE